MKGLVTIVGCGSVGGAIADMLARENYSRNYCLIDPDRMEPKNLKRHVLDHVGVHKVRGVGDHLKRISTCTTLEMSARFESYPHSDLVVCAVDSHECASLVNQRLLEDGTTGVFVSIWGDGKVGEIQVVKPGFPCYNCWATGRHDEKTVQAYTNPNAPHSSSRIECTWGRVLIVASVAAEIILNRSWEPLRLVNVCDPDLPAGMTSVKVENGCAVCDSSRLTFRE